MFRIDRTLVSYDLSEREYTTIRVLPNSADKYAEKKKAAEEEQRAKRWRKWRSGCGIRQKRLKKKPRPCCKRRKRGRGNPEPGRSRCRRHPGGSGEGRLPGRQKGGRGGDALAPVKTGGSPGAFDIWKPEGQGKHAGGAGRRNHHAGDGDGKKVINIGLERDDTLFMELIQSALAK